MSENANTLSDTIEALFNSAISEYTTTTDVNVQFKRAGIKQLGQVALLINSVTSGASADKVFAFIDLIVGEQTKLLADGKSVYQLQDESGGLIVKLIGNSSLLLEVFSSVAHILPRFVSLFTTITEDQYDALELDEQLVIAAGVFAVNYGFFTQSLPPIIKSAIGGLKRKQSGSKLVAKA